MSEQEFGELRRRLELAAYPPDFEIIRGRRQRRTRRWAMSAAAVTVLAMAGGVAMLGLTRASKPPVVSPSDSPSPTAEPSPTPSAAPEIAATGPQLVSLVGAPSGELYLLSSLCDTECVSGKGATVFSVWRSGDQGVH